MTTLLREQTTESFEAKQEVGLGISVRLHELTVGGVLAIAVVAVAAFIRLYALGGRPLGETEAARALLALRHVQGQPTELTGFSPLLTNLNLLVFFLAGASDFWARLVPAVFGIVLVMLPVVRFRHRLGTAGALAASALLAFSPTFLLFSQSVAPAMLTAVTALVYLGALFDFIDRQQRRDLLVAAGALALGLAAGPGIYTTLLFLVIFGMGAWLFHRYRNVRGWDRVVAGYRAIKGDRGGLAQMGAVFGVTFVVAATGFLVNFGGIQAALNLFVDWLASFSLNREYPLWYYAGALVLYEPVISLFGLLGAVMVVRRRDQFGLYLVTWFVGSLVLYTAIGVTEPWLVVPILIPLGLLAGWGVAWLFAEMEEALRALLVTAFIVPMLVYAILQVATYAETPTQSVRLFLALGAAAMSIAIALAFVSSRFGMAWRPATVARGAGISLLVVSMGLSMHMTWHLNFIAREPMRELLLAGPTSPDMREMVSVLETVSQERVGDTIGVPIAVDGRLSPIAPWYLRDFTGVTLIDQVRQPPGTPIVIVPAADEPPPIGDQYVGQGFRVSSRWRPTGLSGSEWIRWYFYREGPAVQNTELVVYVMR